MDDITNPHDRYFRESFSRLEVARDFLRHNLPAVLAPFVLQFRCALHDISARSAAQIRGEVLTHLALPALRHVFSKEPIEPLRELLGLIRQIEDETEATRILYTLLHYYLCASTRLDDRSLRTLLSETPMGEATMQTLYERYRQEGLLEGERKGRQEGEAAIVLRQIERKFGPPDEAVRRRIAEVDAETLLAWSERILTADTLDSLLH
jgi:predicted transposase YdaD